MIGVTRWVLGALAAEKIVQHGVVTWVLMSNEFALRSKVAVDYRWLVAIGMVSAILFAVALVGLIRRQGWSLVLLGLLATFDIIGEFVAQGTLAIAITLSAVVALFILVLSLLAVRRHYTRPAILDP